MNEELPGFENPTHDGDDTLIPKKSNKKGGGFQSMGLSFNVLKGITKRGYKIPTPIQRKTIPLILEGRDVVAMARTGSGKTACFLIPMFERLKARSAKAGARAMVLSPTRELAIQTLKFIRELGRFTDLKASVILGGDSMDDQFAAIHGNPDIIVATPGRFLHVCVEMSLKLTSIEYIVFDEADRLFEMGFGEQLGEIVNRLPETRQTLLFSATLPKQLVEFAKAGLSDPVLLRLDVESKLPDQLKLEFLIVRPEEKLAGLLLLLKNHIAPQQQTIVFAATKHHVEYIHMVLDVAGITNTFIYSNLDPSARKINAAKFQQGKVKVLIVTDVAARGIDIPQLDNVINYNFPAKSKLFIHRVGRCARAGRSGTAYSIIAPDEYAFLLDLHLFLGRKLNIATVAQRTPETNIGRIPQALIEEMHATLLGMHETRHDIAGMQKVCSNAYLQYNRTRPNASGESNKRVKEGVLNGCATHPMFALEDDEHDREAWLDRMKEYRPQGTIFEITGKAHSQDYLAMKQKRAYHKNSIAAFHQKRAAAATQVPDDEPIANNNNIKLTASNADDISSAFSEVVMPKKRKIDALYKRRKDDNFIPYQPADKHTEDGLIVNNFQKDAAQVQMDLTGDTDEVMKRSKNQQVWDRKKKKLVTVNPNSKQGKIKTESGAWISATYKSNRYKEWMEKTKAAVEEEDDDDDASDNETSKPPKGAFGDGRKTQWARHNEKEHLKQRQSELKSTDQILKQRLRQERIKARQKRGKKRRANRKAAKP